MQMTWSYRMKLSEKDDSSECSLRIYEDSELRYYGTEDCVLIVLKVILNLWTLGVIIASTILHRLLECRACLKTFFFFFIEVISRHFVFNWVFLFLKKKKGYKLGTELFCKFFWGNYSPVVCKKLIRRFRGNYLYVKYWQESWEGKFGDGWNCAAWGVRGVVFRFGRTHTIEQRGHSMDFQVMLAELEWQLTQYKS